MLTVYMLIMLMYILYRGHVCCPLSHGSFFLLQNISKLMTFLLLACNAGIPVFFGQVNVACLGLQCYGHHLYSFTEEVWKECKEIATLGVGIGVKEEGEEEGNKKDLAPSLLQSPWLA